MPASVFTIYTQAYDATGLATPLWSVLTRSTDGVALSDVSATNIWASTISAQNWIGYPTGGGGGGSSQWTVSVATLSADTGSTSSAALVGTTMAVPLAASGHYELRVNIPFRTQATTTGLRVRMLGTGSFGLFTGQWQIPTAADGTGGAIQGWDTDPTGSTESVVGTAVQAANTTYLATGRYLIIAPASASSLTFAYAPEVQGSRASVMAGASIIMTQLT